MGFAFRDGHEIIFHKHPQGDVNGTEKDGAVRMQSVMHLYNVGDLLYGLSYLSNLSDRKMGETARLDIQAVRARIYTDQISGSETLF